MVLQITDAMRATIRKQIALATANRIDFNATDDTSRIASQLEGFSLNLDSNVRVYYVHHTLSPEQVIVHLSIHANRGFAIQSEIIEQLATEFGLGQSKWTAAGQPPESSSHVFEVING